MRNGVVWAFVVAVFVCFGIELPSSMRAPQGWDAQGQGGMSEGLGEVPMALFYLSSKTKFVLFIYLFY